MVENLQPNFVFHDERGTLTQLVREGFRQVNVITAKAGCVRGGHYHKINREAFYVVSGRFSLVLYNEDEEEKKTYVAGDMFAIPPMVAHSFLFAEDTVLVSLYDKGVELDEKTKDIYPYPSV